MDRNMRSALLVAAFAVINLAGCEPGINDQSTAQVDTSPTCPGQKADGTCPVKPDATSGKDICDDGSTDEVSTTDDVGSQKCLNGDYECWYEGGEKFSCTFEPSEFGCHCPGGFYLGTTEPNESIGPGGLTVETSDMEQLFCRPKAQS